MSEAAKKTGIATMSDEEMVAHTNALKKAEAEAKAEAKRIAEDAERAAAGGAPTGEVPEGFVRVKCHSATDRGHFRAGRFWPGLDDTGAVVWTVADVLESKLSMLVEDRRLKCEVLARPKRKG